MVVAVVVAVVGLAAGALTYKSLASGPVSFSGEVVPTHVYALSFGAAGTVAAVKVHAGQHVTAPARYSPPRTAAWPGPIFRRPRTRRPPRRRRCTPTQHPQQSAVTREQDAGRGGAGLAGQRHVARVGHGQPRRRDRQPAPAGGDAGRGGPGQPVRHRHHIPDLPGAGQPSSPRRSRNWRRRRPRRASAHQAGQQQEQAAQSRLSERQAALQQVQAQASGVSVTLDQARQRLAAAKATVAQDEIALKATSIVAPAAGAIQPSPRRPETASAPVTCTTRW